MHAWMLRKPELDPHALVARQVVRDQIQRTARISLVNGIQQPQIARRIAARGAQGEGLPVPYP